MHLVFVVIRTVGVVQRGGQDPVPAVLQATCAYTKAFLKDSEQFDLNVPQVYNVSSATFF